MMPNNEVTVGTSSQTRTVKPKAKPVPVLLCVSHVRVLTGHRGAGIEPRGTESAWRVRGPKFNSWSPPPLQSKAKKLNAD